MKLAFYIAVVCVMIGCRARKPASQKTLNFFGQQLRTFPDSLLRVKDAVGLNFGPQWILIDPFGDESDTSGDKISELPEKIYTLRNLKSLNLSCNNIKTLPRSFHKLRRLEFLDLSFNRSLDVRQAVRELRKMKHLKEVNFFGIAEAACDSAYLRNQLGETTNVIVTKSDLKRLISMQNAKPY